MGFLKVGFLEVEFLQVVFLVEFLKVEFLKKMMRQRRKECILLRTAACSETELSLSKLQSCLPQIRSDPVSLVGFKY